MNILAILTTTLPLFSFVCCLIFQAFKIKEFLLIRLISCFSTILIVIACFISWYISYKVFFRNFNGFYINFFDWIPLNKQYLTFGVSINKMSCLMLNLITTVSALVHLYSTEYMKNEKYQRFMINISFFTFCMITLVCSNNFLQMFFGWEGVGVASYLLINYHHKKDSANFASIKAFIVNRFSDVFILFALGLMQYYFHSLNFTDILNSNIILYNDFLFDNFTIIDLICISLFIGSMGKSAQIFLHIWLPDAMEGPTPVSALIHAATMVTAGVFMLCKCAILFDHSQIAMNMILLIGSITCIFAASVALVQTDIKKIIAYSTCSQLGYMFMACGTGFYTGGMFHLLTHGFFKALLFLCAGSVICGTHHNQDIHKMGKNLYKKMPITFSAMLIGSLAISGIPPFSGFYSKDLIIYAAAISTLYFGNFAYLISNLVVFMTSCYSFRLLFLVFFNKNDTHEHQEAHESGWKILLPLFILVFFSTISGYFIEHVIYFIDIKQAMSIFNSQNNINIINKMHTSKESILPLILSLSGIIMAGIMCSHKVNINKIKFIYKFLINKWYFDEIYNAIFIKHYIKISNYLGQKFDTNCINNILVNRPSNVILFISQKTKFLQCGSINFYTTITFITILVLMIIIL